MGKQLYEDWCTNAINWLASQGIAVRGHASFGLAIVTFRHKSRVSSITLLSMRAEQQQLRNKIAEHIADIAGTFAGQLAQLGM